MTTHKAAQLAGRFFIAESNGSIALCQATIFSKNDPGAKAKKLSDDKEQAQRERVGNRRSRAIKKINNKIEHAESAGDVSIAFAFFPP